MILADRTYCFLYLILLASVGIKTMLYFIDHQLMLDCIQEIFWHVSTQNKENIFPEDMEFLWKKSFLFNASKMSGMWVTTETLHNLIW